MSGSATLNESPSIPGVPWMARRKQPKVSLYVDIDLHVRQRIDRLAERRRRNINAEVQFALERYLDTEEAKEQLPPLPPPEPPAEPPARAKRRRGK